MVLAVLIIFGAVWLISRIIESISDSQEQARRNKKRQENISHLQSMANKYPDAYKEWYGAPENISSLSYDELQIRASKPTYSWETKQREIVTEREAENERKRKAEEDARARRTQAEKRKKARADKASSWASKYPNAVKNLVGSRYYLSESQVDKLLLYDESYVSTLETQLKIEKAKQEEAARKRKEEVNNKYNILYNKFPNGVEYVKELRGSKELIEELYTRYEWSKIQRGLSVDNEKDHIIALPNRVYEKYEKIAIEYKNIIAWHESQNEFSNKARDLRDEKCKSWGIYSYKISIDGITRTGVQKSYDFKVWQLFKNSYGISDNVPYTHLKNQLEKRNQLPAFKDASITFCDWVYDEAFDFIDNLGEKVTVVICDSEIGSQWNNIESEHFNYIYEKFRSKQVSNIHLSELQAARHLVSKKIVVLELITENNHLKDVCKQIYSTIENATIVYVSLLKQYDEEELRKLHNKEEENIREAARKAREEEERKRREAREAEERRKREEARRREQEERDRIYRATHDLKTNHLAIRNHLSSNNIRYLYHFTDRRNLESIRRHGGLYSWKYCDTHNINIPYTGGDSMSRSLDCRYDLEDYVRLSFCDDHPMTYRLSQNGYDLVLLKIKVDVAELDATLFSDMNATDNNCNYGKTLADLQRVDLNATKQHYLRNTDPLFKKHQAEVLVKTFIPIDKIVNIDSPQSI